MFKSTQARVFALVVVGAFLYAFSPQAGLFKPTTTDNQSDVKVYHLDIKNRTLSDPREGDLTVSQGSHSMLQVTVDEDGRVDLVSNDRDTFNPVFSSTTNSLSIPTDRLGSYRIEFHPGQDPSVPSQTILIGSVVVR